MLLTLTIPETRYTCRVALSIVGGNVGPCRSIRPAISLAFWRAGNMSDPDPERHEILQGYLQILILPFKFNCLMPKSVRTC